MPQFKAEDNHAGFRRPSLLGGEPSSLTRAKLAAAKLIEPLQHGALSPGLSGIYSIVNAIRLALAGKHHFRDRELADMVAAGLRFMEGRLARGEQTCPNRFWKVHVGEVSLIPRPGLRAR